MYVSKFSKTGPDEFHNTETKLFLTLIPCFTMIATITSVYLPLAGSLS